MSCPVANSGVAAATRRPCAVNHVRRQAAAANLLQAADQKLQIDHRGDHAQKTRPVAHRSAHQKYGARRFSLAHNQRLPVVNPAIAGGGIGSLQFAMQESVGSDAAGGDAFSLGVH